MPVSVDDGDRSAELGQVSTQEPIHAVVTFVLLNAQSESDPVRGLPKKRNSLNPRNPRNTVTVTKSTV